jgi:GAF domain-containing protein
MTLSREAQLSSLLVRLADTLSEDIDLVELMTVLAEGTVSILAVDEAGVVLADPRGSLRVVASSSERMRDLELYEMQNQDGPCLECFSRGEAVLNVHLDANGDDRWPHFGPRARQVGYRVVHAFPIRHRATTIGMVNAFATGGADLTPDEIQVGEAMAQMAAIGLLHQRAVLDRQTVIEQLEHALDARVTVEQAKGVLSERLGTSLLDAYGLLRNYARRNATPVTSVAAAVLTRELNDDALKME